VRVVAGTARGRRLEAPPGSVTRPTSDRVRDAIATALGSLGMVAGSAVLDLWAGSGAMGIELLSRGARSATFVERDRRALETIRGNLERTGLVAASTVARDDALTWCATGGRHDVALCDPPYVFDDWPALLAVVPAPFVVAESARPVAATDGWGLVREKRYGTTVVTFLRRQEQAP